MEMQLYADLILILLICYKPSFRYYSLSEFSALLAPESFVLRLIAITPVSLELSLLLCTGFLKFLCFSHI